MLVVETVPVPQPAANEVLVKVGFAGVNPVDWKIRAGHLKGFMTLAFPYIPGIDFSGSVDAVGGEVRGLSVGQEVFGVAAGSYAEYAIAAAGDVAPLPEGVDAKLAATVPVGALTAWKTVEDAGVSAGQRVAVLGAAGGVGSFAVQLARLKGARVIGTASAANAEFVWKLGAESVVDYASEEVGNRIKGVDVVIDTVGGLALEQGYAMVKPGGILVTVGGQPDESEARERGIRVKRSGRESAGMLSEIGELIRSGRLFGRVGPLFLLAEAARAHDRSETGHSEGRILLSIAG